MQGEWGPPPTDPVIPSKCFFLQFSNSDTESTKHDEAVVLVDWFKKYNISASQLALKMYFSNINPIKFNTKLEENHIQRMFNTFKEFLQIHVPIKANHHPVVAIGNEAWKYTEAWKLTDDAIQTLRRECETFVDEVMLRKISLLQTEYRQDNKGRSDIDLGLVIYDVKHQTSLSIATMEEFPYISQKIYFIQVCLPILLHWMIANKQKFANVKNISLSLSGSNLSDTNHFVKLIQSGALESVTELILPNNQIGANGMTALADAMNWMPHLKKLILTRNEIGCDGLKAFSAALSKATLASLDELELKGNDIGDEGMIAFSSALSERSRTASPLQVLDLCQNRIGDVGMKAFSSALSNDSLKALRILFLHTNMIGDEGMIAFTGACGNLGDLTILDLGTNLITDDGMAKFLSAITPTNETRNDMVLPFLRKLYLGCNEKISDITLDSLCGALNNNTNVLRSLRQLEIDFKEARAGILRYRPEVRLLNCASRSNRV